MMRRIFLLLLAGLGQPALTTPQRPPWTVHPQQRCPLKHRGAVEYGALVIGGAARPTESRVAVVDGDPLSTVVTTQRVYRCTTCGVLFTLEAR